MKATMSITAPTDIRPLGGCRILVPRGGPWGNTVASELRARGAAATIAPMTNFVVSEDAETLQTALTDLAAGKFDWVTFTSGTTVDVVSAYRAEIPDSTKVAAVGETTAAALKAAGYRADLTPSEDNTAHGLLVEWNAATGGVVPLRILTLRAHDATPVLTKGLIRIGHDVRQVVAYRTVGVDLDEQIAMDARTGNFDVVLVTSGSVAEQVAQQIGEMPDSVVVAAVGERTAKDAKAYGVRVDLVVPTETDAMVDAIVASRQNSN